MNFQSPEPQHVDVRLAGVVAAHPVVALPLGAYREVAREVVARAEAVGEPGVAVFRR